MADLIGFAKGAFAQFNPFDGGQDYNSVMRKRKQEEQVQQQRPQVPQAQTPYNQRVQSAAQQVKAYRPTITAPNLNQNSVIKRTNPSFDPMKAVGGFVNDTAKNIGNAVKPISKGGINPLADAGKFVENNIVKPGVETAAKVGNTVALPVLATGAAVTGLNRRKEVQDGLYGVMKNSFISPEVASGKANPLEFAKQFTEVGVKTAELLPLGKGLSAAKAGTKLTLPRVGQALAANAREAAVLGSASTGNDLLQGREVNLGTLAANYAAPTALGAGSDIAGALVRPALRGAGEIPSRATNFGLVRPNNLSEPEINASLRMRQAAEGYISNQEVTPDEALLYRQAQTKLGAQPGTVDGDMAVVDALGAQRNFDTVRAQRKQQVQELLQRSSKFAQDNLMPGSSMRKVDDAVVVPQVQPAIRKPLVEYLKQPADVGGRIPPRTMTAAPMADIPPNIPKQAVATIAPVAQKTSRYADKTIPGSEFVGDEVSSLTKKNAPTYVPETERGRYEQTLKSADQKGFDEFENDVILRLNQKNINSQTVADSQAVAQRLEAKGDDISLRRAAEIYDNVSRHLTESGQTIQAAAIIARRTPQGMKYQALKDLRNAGVQITPELQRQINERVAAIAKTQPKTEAQKKALGELAKVVSANIPTDAVSNLVSVWKAGLLSGVKTTGGGIASNATFAGLKKASDPLTILTDKLISLKTGQRTATGTQRGGYEGLKQGVENAKYTLKTGIDLREVSDKYEQRSGINFKNPTVNKVLGKSQKVFDLMSAQDQPFWYSQMKNSMYDLAKADGINKGLKGGDLTKYMDDIASNPPEHIAQKAADEANRATLNFDTIGSKAIRGIHQGIDNFKGSSDAGKMTAHAIVDVLAPFVRVPTAFLARTIDYTPLGIGKTAFTQIAKKQFDQRAFSKAVGESATGTGVIAMGVALANSDLLSGEYPSDPTESQRWKAERITPNSVKLGDTWYSLNYMGPLGMLLAAGKNYDEALKNGGNGEAIVKATAGLGQSLMGQSFLQGFTGFSDAIQDPERELQSFLNSQLSSVVPALSNDLANLFDGMQRQANNPIEAAMNKIPGLRQTLNAKQDVYGNKLDQAAGQVNVINPLKPSNERDGIVLDEISRLSKVDTEDRDLQLTPKQVEKKLKFGDTEVKLSDQQRYDLQKEVGQFTQSNWEALIKSDDYQSLNDKDKANALKKLKEVSSELAARKFVSANSLGEYTDKMSKGARKLDAGKAKLSSFAKESNEDGDYTGVDINEKVSESARKTLEDYDNMDSDERKNLFNEKPDAEFNYNYAKYENDLANNSLSEAQKIKAQQSLRKEQAGKDFPKEVRELYGVNENQLAKYIGDGSDPAKAKIAQQLLAYDQALVNSGELSKLKFKGGVGAKSGSGGKGGSKGNSAGASLVSLQSSINKIRAPRTTGSKAPQISSGIKAPQLQKTALKRYAVQKSAISTRKDERIKTSKA
ncbi:MAG: hypothetical protein EON54_01330 [Alcaligenaceae bacterium]|nr:MAG: hypothetical protein EON54_01330 [Alcaligenaceae bacterium]